MNHLGLKNIILKYISTYIELPVAFVPCTISVAVDSPSTLTAVTVIV